jgi:hypothetical protein
MHLAATALSSLQELPHFKAKDHYGVDAGLIDFSLLGDTDATLSEIFTNMSKIAWLKYFLSTSTLKIHLYTVLYTKYTHKGLKPRPEASKN